MATLLAVTTSVSPVPAVAAPGVSLSRTAVDAAPDFATQQYADAWDFVNADDMSLAARRAGEGTSNLFLADGVYYATVAAGGWLNLVQTISGQLPWGRDGQVIPIDAARYTRFSVRMWSEKADVAKIWWNNCPQMALPCYGATLFTTHAGWGTYDVALTKRPDTSANWTGKMLGIRIDPISNKGGRVALDWVRIYQPSAGAAVTVTGTPNSDVIVDQDTNPANSNETVVRRDNAALRTDGAGRAVLDASLLAPGTWQVATRTIAGAVSYAGTPLTVGQPPVPVVLDPDITGGADVNEVMGSSRWDMNESTDVSSHPNATGHVANGMFHGRNAGPTINDPVVSFTMPGDIDGSRFHRLTMKVSYDGPWGLEDSAGGGMMARWVWAVQGNDGLHSSNDLVVSPGDQTITVDLAGDPNVVIDEGSQIRAGWAGQSVRYVRFDPNEDPSTARTWRVDDIRLAQDDEGNGQFAVRFQDAAWAPGTVADIAVDRGAPGANRTTIATNVPVQNGVNTYKWNLGSLPAGTYWVHVTMKRGSAVGTASSTGPVQMRAATPFGSLDAAEAVGSDGVRIRGWAIDPKYNGAASPVHVYVAGRGVALQTGAARPDVASAFGSGPNQGFDHTMTGLPAGTHQACAYAYRDGGSALLGCRSVIVGKAFRGSDTIGSYDAVAAATGGARVTGWALDLSTDASISTHVYVDGRFAVAAPAEGSRPDIAAAFAGYGDRHGFDVTVPTSPGWHTVCVFGIDRVAPGSNKLLACRNVHVPVGPMGSVEQVNRSGDSVSLSGWVVDPRATTAAVHVYVDGAGAANIPTTVARPDVNAVIKGFTAPTPGFAHSITVGPGHHQVCLFAIGAQANTLMHCRSI